MQALFEIVDTIPLDGLGYDKGSEVKVNLNLTRSWDLAYSAIWETKRNDNEPESDYLRRIYLKQYELVAGVVIKSVVVKKGGEEWKRTNVTAADVQELDERINEMILELVMQEVRARNATRMLQAKYPFQVERDRLLERGKQNNDSAANGSNRTTEPDKAH
jgi:hypothetical protein